MTKKLTIIIPCYNEEVHIEKVLTRINDLRIDQEKEVILVNDGSVDHTPEKISSFQSGHPGFPIQVFHHQKNRGKGACIRTAIPHITGEVVIIQDADLEYDPGEYPVLLGPLLEGKADVVYGSRFLGGGPHRVLYFWHSVGNFVLTLLSNCLTNVNLSDMETCYKAFRREVIQAIPIEENRFGFEPEITVKIAKRRLRIYEVGISYWGRTYEEGKKIGWKDGFRALWCLLKYSIKEPVRDMKESQQETVSLEIEQKLHD